MARPVALKLIRPDVAASPGYRGRFLRSWRIAGSLDHPSVIPIHDAGEHDGQLFLAARFVDGVDLERLSSGTDQLAAPRAARLTAKAATALDAAHARGLVHGGLTARNLLLTGSGEREHLYITGWHADGHDGDGRPDLRALAEVVAAAVDGAARSGARSPHRAVEQRAAPLDAVLLRALSSEPGDGYPSGRELAAAATAAAPPLGEDRTAGVEAGRATATGEGRARRGRLLAVAALALVGVVAVAAVMLGGRSSTSAPAALSGTIVGPPIRPGDGPWGVAVGGGFLWVANGLDDTVVRIDPRSHRRVGRPVAVGDAPNALAFGDGSAWVANNDDDTVVRLDAATGRVVGRPIPVGDEPFAIATGAGSVWTYNLDGTVTRIDARTMRAAGEPIVVGPRSDLGGVAFVAGRVWVTEGVEDTLSAIDPASNRVVGRPLQVGDAPWGVTGDGNVVWVANSGDGTVVRVDASTARMIGEPLAVGRSPTAVAAGDGAVWVAAAETLSRIDPRRARIAGRPLRIAEDARALAFGAGGVWVPHYDHGTITHVAPSREEGR